MPRLVSSTGLIAARTRPIRRPKPKKLELLGSSIPAPFILRPFAGLFNPYSYSCSVFCNHPANGDAKKVVRRAKDMWASEGKALQLPVEVHEEKPGESDALDSTTVPEELFRRYTEMDSRSASPQHPIHHESFRDDKGRPSLILDLRASPHDAQKSETLSWHALTLEPMSCSRRGVFIEPARKSPRKLPLPWRRHHVATTAASSPVHTIPILKVSDSLRTNVARNTDDEKENEEESSREEEVPVRRKGKLRRKKRKCRRGSIYGQQTEVRDPPEPLETLVSQIVQGSRRESTRSNFEEIKRLSLEKIILPAIKHEIPSSFLPPDIIKELSRELDQGTIEWEFNAKRRFALEEVLRVLGDFHPTFGGSCQNTLHIQFQNIPRLFYRQSARFELLGSQSLIGLKPVDYLSQYVYVNDVRKMIFGRAFNKYREETIGGPRYLISKRIFEALSDVMGWALLNDEVTFLERSLGAIQDKLDFRTWCGLCAFTERSLPALLPQEEDPPSWLEKADFEMLDCRLSRVEIDEKLASMLLLIRDR
ncbi:PREDICTED: uncharacterized protein LOC105364107 [Ceratosolen solmsi marchali]|uniref:Uncharacterized protein LOC105364107 n=1 Tax=Ceratosolen solmsi marchali TaxID=326594 RepID=A0AAJ6YLI8_9HYME|nr:PREDICTED: uncharacterized protein LOC105364107 [Ceratosolen solmsi marchali]